MAVPELDIGCVFVWGAVRVGVPLTVTVFVAVPAEFDEVFVDLREGVPLAVTVFVAVPELDSVFVWGAVRVLLTETVMETVRESEAGWDFVGRLESEWLTLVVTVDVVVPRDFDDDRVSAAVCDRRFE